LPRTSTGLSPVGVRRHNTGCSSHAGLIAIERLDIGGGELPDRVVIAGRVVGVVAVQTLEPRSLVATHSAGRNRGRARRYQRVSLLGITEVGLGQSLTEIGSLGNVALKPANPSCGLDSGDPLDG
jgi:hypothetical protein